VFVEGGTFTMGKVQDDVMHDWNNTPTQQHVQSFYMDETEVTNLMYLEYLNWLKKVFPPTEENYKNSVIKMIGLNETLIVKNEEPEKINNDEIKDEIKNIVQNIENYDYDFFVNMALKTPEEPYVFALILSKMKMVRKSLRTCQ
jgi:gliding motility-associated lipoprotein GldJ